MSIYETVKSQVSVREAAERYGLNISRSGMTRCPFHDDHTPSMKVVDDHYHCFGCGAHGDVISFTAKLFGIRPYDAAKKLSYDFGLDTTRPVASFVQTKRYPQKDEHYCLLLLTEYASLLSKWKHRYAPKAFEEPLDNRYMEACHMENYIDYIIEQLDFASPDERTQTVEMLKQSGLFAKLEERLRKETARPIEQEVSHEHRSFKSSAVV